MLKAISQSYSGVRGHQQMMDVTANNIANVNTTGYKQIDPSFQELTYRAIKERRLPREGNPLVPPQSGRGTAVFSTTPIMAQGSPVETLRSLDVSILGEGFFRVIRPDGSYAYTRDGGFIIDDEGQIALPGGGILLDPHLRLGEYENLDLTTLQICKDGRIIGYPYKESIEESENTEEDLPVEEGALPGGAMLLGEITLYRFINPESLNHIGGNMFILSDASGPPVAGVPGENGFGRLESGYLERSNVNLGEQMANLIRGERALQASARAISAADELWGITNNIIQA